MIRMLRAVRPGHGHAKHDGMPGRRSLQAI